MAEWKLLGFLIGDRNSQDDFEMFCAEHKCEGKETCTMLREWQKMHPYASWTLLYQALIKMNEKEIHKHIKEKYLSGLCEVPLCVQCYKIECIIIDYTIYIGEKVLITFHIMRNIIYSAHHQEPAHIPYFLE